jgi:uncharacterized membrane protein (DUF4010 family)
VATDPLGIIVAALGGMAIGIERQWSGHATGPRARFGGIRTFAMLGGFAGVAGWLYAEGIHAMAAVLLAAAAGLIVAAYAAGARREIDATTEVGALVVLAAGVLSGMGHAALAGGIIAVTAIVLLEKTRLHALVQRIDDAALRAAFRFAVMAIVILPLLPTGPYGPFDAVRPRELWLLVLFCSALSFAGYITRRAVGEAHGYPLAGLLGGMISSTNVTLSFAHASRAAARLRMPLASGVVAACTVLFIRVLILTAAINPPLARALLPMMLAPFAVGLAVLAVSVRNLGGQTHAMEPPRNPLAIKAALQMTAMFQLVLFGVAIARHAWGDAGIVVSGAVLGVTDVDALAISMARAAATGVSVDVAARALAVGILANTSLKLIIVLVLGVATFRGVTAGALLAMALALAGTLAFVA